MNERMQVVVKNVQNGDREAFSEIIREYQARLRVFMRVVLWDGASVDDVTQEAFVTAYLRIDAYDAEKGDLYSWLKGIARHLAQEENRRRGKRCRWEEGYLTDLRVEHEEATAAGGAGRLEAMYDRLSLCLKRLSDRIQTLFRRLYEDQMTIEELAASESLPGNTVRVMLFRARTSLKKCLERQGS